MWLVFSKWTNFTRWLDSLNQRFWCPDIRELIIMFWYSWIGKTEFTFFVAKANAQIGNKVDYISLELPKQDMYTRMCQARAGVSKYQFQNNLYNERQKETMIKTRNELDSLTNLRIVTPLDDDYHPNNEYRYIDRAIRKGYDEWVRMFFIDNLDKVLHDKSSWNENARYQAITSALQDLKNELNICIFVIHHSAKKGKNQVEQRSWVEWLRGSQKIVDNSTQVFEIFRDLDVNDPSFSHNITEVLQYKDSNWWPKWREKVQYRDWTFVEYDKEKTQKELEEKKKKLKEEKKENNPF